MARTYGITNVAPWAAAPTLPATGDTYYNTATKLLYVYDGTAWSAVGPSAIPADISNGYVIQPSTMTFSTPTVVTINADVRPVVSIGTAIRYFQAGVWTWGYISSISYSAGTSTVGIIGTSAVANSAITEWDVTYGFPADFPAFIPWTPTFTAGFSTSPTGIADGFTVTEGWCYYTIRHSTAGVSNAATYQFSAPFTAKTVTNGTWFGFASVYDNSTVATTPGVIRIISNTSTFLANKDTDTSTDKWTTSNNKRITGGFIWYPIR